MTRNGKPLPVYAYQFMRDGGDLYTTILVESHEKPEEKAAP